LRLFGRVGLTYHQAAPPGRPRGSEQALGANGTAWPRADCSLAGSIAPELPRSEIASSVPSANDAGRWPAGSRSSISWFRARRPRHNAPQLRPRLPYLVAVLEPLGLPARACRLKRTNAWPLLATISRDPRRSTLPCPGRKIFFEFRLDASSPQAAPPLSTMPSQPRAKNSPGALSPALGSRFEAELGIWRRWSSSGTRVPRGRARCASPARVTSRSFGAWAATLPDTCRIAGRVIRRSSDGPELAPRANRHVRAGRVLDRTASEPPESTVSTAAAKPGTGAIHLDRRVDRSTFPRPHRPSCSPDRSPAGHARRRRAAPSNRRQHGDPACSRFSPSFRRVHRRGADQGSRDRGRRHRRAGCTPRATRRGCPEKSPPRATTRSAEPPQGGPWAVPAELRGPRPANALIAAGRSLR